MKMAMILVEQAIEGIVGDITPHGECFADEQSLENMRKFEDVCLYVLERLEVALRCKDAVEGSRQDVARETLKSASCLLNFVERAEGEWRV